MLPTPVAILFDLDGTLVDTVPTRIAAWGRTLDEVGIPHDRAALGRLIGSDGAYLVHQLAEAAGLAIDDQRADAIDRRSGEIYDELNTDPRPLPGVGEALAAIERAGLPWAIATSSRAEQVGASVAALRLARRPLVVDGGAVARAKPAPDLMLAAAARLGVDPTDCWYIGDSTWDMLAGVAARMTTIGVTVGGAVSADDLRAAGASLVLAESSELIAHLPA
jgi:HAD superfamily hydrolase (TIGR01509 family)